MTARRRRATERDLRAMPTDGRAGEVIPEGCSPVPPDLAVEILSPEDRSRFVLEKDGEYLDAGVPLVWVIDPRARNPSIYRSLTDVRKLSEADELDGEDALPGFRCRLADIL